MRTRAILVTEKHWNESTRDDRGMCISCPLERAIADAGFPGVAVGMSRFSYPETFTPFFDIPSIHRSGLLSHEAIVVREKFDAHQPMPKLPQIVKVHLYEEDEEL